VLQTTSCARFAAILLTLTGLVSGVFIGQASASTFNVSPTQVFLSGKASSALLTLRNDSEEPLRFQLSVFAWDQSPSGEMTLAPTQDVVFFPALLTLAPKEERKIRVGRMVAPANVERTYRIFVEELPSLEAVSNPAASVKVLTKMGIPIFVRPAKEDTTAGITGAETHDGTLHFTLANSGTVHFVPERIIVRGLADGKSVFETQIPAWYVLAGGKRDFEFELPKPDCGRATALQVQVAFNSSTIDQRVELPAGSCTQ